MQKLIKKFPIFSTSTNGSNARIYPRSNDCHWNFILVFYMLWHCKNFLSSWNLLWTRMNWYWSVNKRNCLYFTCNYYFLLNAWFLFILMSIHDARSSFTSPLNSFVSFFSSIKHLRRGSDKGGVASKPPINYNPLEYDQTHPAQKQMPVEI